MTTTDAITWLMSTWKSMAAYRRAIPDENTGTLLLWEIQNGCCCVCWPRIECPDRVMDHDHETGMVRGWLCRACNNKEGRNTTPVLEAYRRYAPGNGLFIRSTNGWNDQWERWPDPWPNRRQFESLEEYKRLLPSLSASRVPRMARQRFNLTGPIPQRGERFKTEMEYLTDIAKGVRWPITGAKTPFHSKDKRARTRFQEMLEDDIGLMMANLLEEDVVVNKSPSPASKDPS